MRERERDREGKEGRKEKKTKVFQSHAPQWIKNEITNMYTLNHNNFFELGH